MIRMRFVAGILCCIGSVTLILVKQEGGLLAGGIALLIVGIVLIATARRAMR